MNELIELLEERIKRANNYATELENFASALESLERVRLMRQIAQKGIEIEISPTGGRIQIRIK